MKKFKFFAIAFAAIALLASCETEIVTPSDVADPAAITDPTGDPVTIHFTALADPATRTAFGAKDGTTYPTLWTDNDSRVQLYYRVLKGGEVAKQQNGYATVTPSVDYRSATFTKTFDGLSDAMDSMDSVVFYAISPASAHSGWSSSYIDATITIPTLQTPLDGSPDEAAQILAAKTGQDEFTSAPSSVGFNFRHVTSYGRFSIINLDYGAETVESVALTAAENWVGTYYYYFNTKSLEARPTASTTLTLDTDSLTDIWFACAPVDLGGKTITVSVNTDGGVYTKDITIPSGKKFTAGKVAAFTVDMDGILKTGTKVYTKVTDVTELTADSEVIIVAADANYAMGDQADSYRSVASVTKSGSDINNPSGSVAVFTVVDGEVDNTLAFKSSDDKYLYASSSSANQLKSQTTKDANGSWSISITDAGVATVKAQGTNTRNWMRYNGDRITCYGSGQNDISIYKLSGTGDGTVLVREVCEPASFDFFVNTVVLSTETEGASIYYTTNGDTPTASSTLYTTPFSIAEDVTVKAIVVKENYLNSAVVSRDFEYSATPSITIIPDNATTGVTESGYITEEKSFKASGLTLSVNNVNPGTLQVRGNQTSSDNLQSGTNFYIHNTASVFSKTITRIVITYSTVYTTFVEGSIFASTSDSAISSQSAATSSNPTHDTSGKTLTWDFDPASSGGYFAIGMQKGATSGIAKISSITITYQ